MAKVEKTKRGPGRPAGTGLGYDIVIRSLITGELYAALREWQAENGVKGESEAVRLLITDALLKRPGRAKAGR